MDPRMQQLLEKIGRWPVVAMLAVPTFGFFTVFNFHPSAVPALLRLSGVPPLDVQWAYGPQEIASLFAAYGAEGRQRYAVFLSADILFAVSYGVFFAALFQLALRPLVRSPASRWNYLALLPLFAGAADCVENLGILALLGAYPGIPVALAYTASTATLAKWLLAGGGICAILAVLGLRLVRLRKSNTL